MKEIMKKLYIIPNNKVAIMDETGALCNGSGSTPLPTKFNIEEGDVESDVKEQSFGGGKLWDNEW